MDRVYRYKPSTPSRITDAGDPRDHCVRRDRLDDHGAGSDDRTFANSQLIPDHGTDPDPRSRSHERACFDRRTRRDDGGRMDDGRELELARDHGLDE
jgi:hypothetical protein